METMGNKFRATREQKNISLSKAAALTRIKIQHLEMMENDDFSKMPAPTYAKGFIRIYASFLGLDPAPLVDEYIERHLNPEDDPRASVQPPEKPAPVSRAPSRNEETSEPAPRPRKPRTAPWKKIKLLPALQKAWAAVVPFLPRMAGIAVAVLLLVGMVRCAVTMTNRADESSDGPSLMERNAMMKEPPVRYLELPAQEENQP